MKSPSLSEIIADEITAQGPITFARFMDLALYHPTLGYYTSGTAQIGRKGDFYTNVSVGPVFGRVLASQFEEMWERLGRPTEFIIVEQGAHEGHLASDILAAATEPFATALHYRIVEPSSSLRTRQQELLKGRPVKWYTDMAELPPFCGVHFSNELVDALPFHIVESQGDDWAELYVSSEDEGFTFVRKDFSPAIAPQKAQLTTRAAGTLAELRPLAHRWLDIVADRLTAGFILLVDYGFPRDQLLSPHRTRGTFACFQKHRRDDDVLASPGEKDITAHVDFTSLAEHARTIGLHREGFTDQHHFIIGSGEPLLRSLEGRIAEPEARKTLRAMQTLLHPESMGTQFHYLGFSKDAPGETLRGFRYERGAKTLSLET